MTVTAVASVNGVDIMASRVELGLVPIRPICEALGVQANAQREKLNSNPLYSSVITLARSTCANGKRYKMSCLPYVYCIAWILDIHVNNVKKESREKLFDNQRACIDAINGHFTGNERKQVEINRLEIASLEKIGELTETKRRLESELKAEKEHLQNIRSERFNEQPSLFD